MEPGVTDTGSTVMVHGHQDGSPGWRMVTTDIPGTNMAVR